MSGTVNVTFKNTGTLTVQTYPTYCGTAAEVPNKIVTVYNPGSSMPLTPGLNSTRPACTPSVPKSVVGATFFAPGAKYKDEPVAWYFYDFVGKSVVAQKQSPLINLTAVPTVNTGTASVLSLTVDPSVKPLDPLPRVKDWMDKYWWLLLIVLAVIVVLVIGIVMGVRR